MKPGPVPELPVALPARLPPLGVELGFGCIALPASHWSSAPGFGVNGSWFRVQDLGFRASSLCFRVRVWGLGFRVEGSGFRVYGLGVTGYGLRVRG